MAYDSTFPADDGYLADFPAGQREQHRAIINDKIVDAGTLKGATSGNAKNNIPVSNGTVCTSLNADLLDGKHATAFSLDGHTHAAATTSSNGMMSNTDKAKLDSIATGAEVNQNAFANVKVGSTTIQADAKQDTLTLVAGSNITLTPDATNDKVTIAATNTTYANFTKATADAAGTAGLVPAPAAGKQASYLRGDGTWAVPTNTTYSNFVKSGSGAKAGLVPAPSTTAGTTKYLREDGTWQVPPNTNTDTKVTNTLGTTTKFYLCGTTGTATNTGGLVFDTGIYSTTTAGQLYLTSIVLKSGIVIS